MIIRKSFWMRNAHVVRNCSSDRCKFSVHGHAYEIEFLIRGDFLDRGHMVYDFGLMKPSLGQIVKSFDNAITLWTKDSDSYIADAMNSIPRWVITPVSPSAERYAEIFLDIGTRLFECVIPANDESNLSVHSVRVHETRSGWAEAFACGRFQNAICPPDFSLMDIQWSPRIQKQWKDKELWHNLMEKKTILNSHPLQQVI